MAKEFKSSGPPVHIWPGLHHFMSHTLLPLNFSLCFCLKCPLLSSAADKLLWISWAFSKSPDSTHAPSTEGPSLWSRSSHPLSHCGWQLSPSLHEPPRRWPRPASALELSAWPRVWHGAQGPLPVLEPVHARHREAARQLAAFSSLEYKPGCTHRIHACAMETIGCINHWFGKALKYFHNIVCFFSKTDVPLFHEKVIKCVWLKHSFTQGYYMLLYLLELYTCDCSPSHLKIFRCF